MKNIFKVTILFCLIIGIFIIPVFADNDVWKLVYRSDDTFNNNEYLEDYSYMFLSGYNYYYNACSCYPDLDIYLFLAGGNTVRAYIAFTSDTLELIRSKNDTIATVYVKSSGSLTPSRSRVDYSANFTFDDNTGLYYYRFTNYGWSNLNNDSTFVKYCPIYSDYSDGLYDIADYIENNNTPTYNKNANVDEFIANTLISMGVKFDTPAYALSYASAAWNWCTDEENVESAHPFDEWSIDSFVSYCNAQSNNYLNWYNGYKVHEDVTKALGEYIRQNIRSLTGLPAGITSLTGAYLPIYHYGSGFQSGVSSPTAQTFYPAQTITYFNGEYVNETDDISTSQFLYSPADVRRFLGYPATGSVVIPSDPAAGTGTITDDPNNQDQKNIDINFPSLDWLADAINSILDFLRDAFTTLANLLTQLLDAILGLFSDAFASLADFGQGIIEFLQSVFAGLSTLLNGYVPSDLAVIIACFIALNFGIGLITFILKGH